MKNWIKHHRLELLLFLTTLIVRLFFSLAIHPIQNYIFSDMGSYFDISIRLASLERSVENIFYPIGYPLFLVFVSRLIPTFLFPSIAVLQSLMGLASLILLYRISKNILAPRFRLIFLIILVFYYPWIDFGGYLMSETLATFILILMAYLALFYYHHRNLLWLFFLPLVIALAALVRANLLLTGILLVFWPALLHVFRVPQLKPLQLFRPTVVFFCGAAIAVAISFLTYWRFSNVITPLALNGGLVFAQGQCLLRGATDINGWSFGPPVFTQRNIQKEIIFDQPFINSNYFYQTGIDCLRANPWRILGKITEPYYLFFDNTAWPSSDQRGFGIVMRVSHAFFNLAILPGFILSVYIFVKNSKKLFGSRLAIIFLTTFSLIISTVIYHADIRYRLPFDGFFILLSLWAYQRFKIKKNSRLLPE